MILNAKASKYQGRNMLSPRQTPRACFSFFLELFGLYGAIPAQCPRASPHRDLPCNPGWERHPLAHPADYSFLYSGANPTGSSCKKSCAPCGGGFVPQYVQAAPTLTLTETFRQRSQLPAVARLFRDAVDIDQQRQKR
jgi:hypothetical protein